MGIELSWAYYGPFGFALLLANPGETLGFDTRVTLDLLEERGAYLMGTADQIAEKILALKNELGFDDFNFGVQLELAGFSSEENEEQMHLFAEEVVPILRRECGPSP